MAEVILPASTFRSVADKGQGTLDLGWTQSQLEGGIMAPHMASRGQWHGGEVNKKHLDSSRPFKRTKHISICSHFK